LISNVVDEIHKHYPEAKIIKHESKHKDFQEP